MRIDHNTTKKLWPNRRRNSVEKTSPNLQHIDGATIAADNNSSAILKSGIKMTLEASIEVIPSLFWSSKNNKVRKIWVLVFTVGPCIVWLKQ